MINLCIYDQWKKKILFFFFSSCLLNIFKWTKLIYRIHNSVYHFYTPCVPQHDQIDLNLNIKLRLSGEKL